MRSVHRLLPASLAVALVLVVAAGCGSSGPPEKGLLISGPQASTSQPPWPAQYANLKQRLAALHLPAGGSEKFHTHALLSVYNQGIYVTVPANVGLDPRHNVESPLHTHDRTGIVHMESPVPFRFTLGDFFAVWGVRFGAGTLGPFEDNGGKRVWVYVNGKPISDPARHVMANNDNIVVAYGTAGSFPRQPSTALLKRVESGGSALPCSSGGNKKRQTSCVAPAR